MIVKFVEISHSSRQALVEVMHKRFGPERGARFEALFCESIGHQITIQEQHRLKAHHVFRAAATRLGLTYATCYEYKYRRNDAGKILDKMGVSVGPEFTTADQCHGHRVPLYTRANLTDRFEPVPHCPPSGCLSCATPETAPAGACGSERFGAARALKPSDFTHFVYEEKIP